MAMHFRGQSPRLSFINIIRFLEASPQTNFDSRFTMTIKNRIIMCVTLSLSELKRFLEFFNQSTISLLSPRSSFALG